MHALVAAGAPVHPSPLVEEAVRDARLFVGADGGSAFFLARGLTPHLVVGDMDSLTPALEGKLQRLGVEILRLPAAKDKTDTHLALEAAFERGVRRVTLLGAMGGERLDHGAANLLLLGSEQFRGREVVVIEGASRAWVTRGKTAVSGAPGDLLTLLPLTPTVEGITLRGFLYPLADATLHFGDSLGVSNELTEATGEVQIRAGVLLVVHTVRALLENQVVPQA